jgi:hypothetical protein
MKTSSSKIKELLRVPSAYLIQIKATNVQCDGQPVVVGYKVHQRENLLYLTQQSLSYDDNNVLLYVGEEKLWVKEGNTSVIFSALKSSIDRSLVSGWSIFQNNTDEWMRLFKVSPYKAK